MTRLERLPEGAGSELLSTRTLAEMLRVSEATVKRWTDDGLIPCYRTPGGHRRFRHEDVEAFIRTSGVVAPRSRVSDATPAETLRLALAMDLPGLERMAVNALENGLSVEALCDEVLAPALVEIGQQWAGGAAGVGDEHLVTSGVIDLLSRLRIRFERRAVEGRQALVACAPGKRHELVARMLSLCLRARGYVTLDLGADTPFDEIARIALARKIDLVALSASGTSQEVAAMRQGVAELWRQLRPEGIALFVGGAAFEQKQLPSGVHWAANFRKFGKALETLAS